MIRIDNDWQDFFDMEQVKPYYLALRSFLKDEYRHKSVFPPMDEIFQCFHLTSFADTKVVIVGQDPYHEKGQAMGLSFSVREGVQEPPSLKNIHKEILSEDTEKDDHWSSDLSRWARQGVLLLNSTLTVVEHRAASHAGKGWETLTDGAIAKLGRDKKRRVFMLWGNYARSKKYLIDSGIHLVLESPHPSPLSASHGFFGNGHFRACNEFLKSIGESPIYW